MNRSSRVVHLISLIALVVSLFSPVLTQAVTAEDPPPEPNISLETVESTPESPPETTNTDPPNVPTDIPQLIPVIPTTPILADASCVDGTIYSQTATAPVTDGVQYEISPADAAGNFTVTATLTDPATYRWADSGLDGWVVNGNQATSSGVLALCPIAEAETPAPTTPAPEIVEKTSGESTPATRARSGGIGPTANEGAMLTYSFAADKTHANFGDELTITITVTNIGTANADRYLFTTELSAGGSGFIHKDPIDLIQPEGAECTYGERYTALNCDSIGTEPLAPSSSHTYVVTVKVNTTSTCLDVMTRGGGEMSDGLAPWTETSQIRGSNPPRFFTQVNCPAQLSLSMINDAPANVEPGDTFKYTVTATRSGNGETGEYTFTVELPEQIELNPDSTYITPANASCSLEGVIVTCVGGGVGANEPLHTFKIPVRVKWDLALGNCGVFTSIANGLGPIWGSNNTATSQVERICKASLTLDFGTDLLGASMNSGQSFSYLITVDNVGGAVSGDYLFRVYLPNGVELNTEIPFSVPDGQSCVATVYGFECSGSGIPINGSYLYQAAAIVDISNDPQLCTYVSTTASGIDGEWQPGRETSVVAFEIRCQILSLSASVDTGDEAGVVLFKPFDYNLSVTNSGQTADGDFSVSAVLNPNVNIAGDLPAGCSATPQQGSTLITCTGNTVPIGESGVTFSIPLMVVDENFEYLTCYDNTILGYGTGDGLWLTAPGMNYLDTPTDCTTDVSTSISPLSSPVNPGDPIGWTVTFTNIGSLRVTDLSLFPPFPDPLPDGATWTTSWELNGEPFDIDNFSPLYPNDVLVYTVQSPPVPDDITGPESEWCQDRAYAPGYDFETANMSIINLLESTVSVNCTDLQIVQQVSSATIAPNGGVTYTITITNNGNHTISPVQMYFENTGASQLFSNWQISSPDATECWADEGERPSCWWVTMEPQQTSTVTITADAAGPETTMCELVTTSANVTYGEVLQPLQLMRVALPYTPVESNEVSTQLDCTYDLDIDYSEELLTGEDGRMDAGDQIRYTFTIVNTGTLNLYDIAVSEEAGLLDWESDPVISELPAGEEAVLTATYTVTQADLDNGSISISAIVSGNAPSAPVTMLGFAAQAAPDPTVTTPVEVTTALKQEPALTLALASSPDASADPVEIGDTMTYTFTVTNDGNVTLTDVAIAGDLADLQFAHGTTIASIAPGASAELSATYAVTAEDVTAGSLALCVDATALDPTESAVAATQVCLDLQVAAQPVATPAPSTPTAGETPAPTAGVTGLPDTGQGSPLAMTPFVWAATMSILALGGIAFGVRRTSRS